MKSIKDKLIVKTVYYSASVIRVISSSKVCMFLLGMICAYFVSFWAVKLVYEPLFYLINLIDDIFKN